MLNEIVLFHVSDLHFSDDTLRFRDLTKTQGMFSKQTVGWMNYRLRRRSQFRSEFRQRVIDQLKRSDWDYLVISGDLTSLSLDREFRQARNSLEPLIQKGRVIITPGNHDRYVPAALNPDLLAKHFGDCFPFSDGSALQGDVRCLELGEKAVLMEIDMSVPRSPISSRGRLGADWEKQAEILSKKYKEWLKIVVGHYPAFLPKNKYEGFLHSLAGKKKLQRFLVENRVDLYLHGHIHESWRFTPKRSPYPLSINSGGCIRYSAGSRAGFHRIVLQEKKFEVERITI
ncbi:MAG: metallophosphoesterase [Proteobacteria bacterium]|nr:metallophosphoesterase [Pseudomonadota bacterium]